MWAPHGTPWQVVSRWGSASNAVAVANARAASTQLSRLRVERQEVELFLRERGADGRAAGVPQPA